MIPNDPDSDERFMCALCRAPSCPCFFFYKIRRSFCRSKEKHTTISAIMILKCHFKQDRT